MVYLTGDTHGDFSRVYDFCSEYSTCADDVLIILGDAGINYYLDGRDTLLKDELAQLPITLFCVHGNHEERAANLCGYVEKLWHGAAVLYEEDYPNIIFAQDGEIYDFEGNSVIVLGGAYSVDKYYRLARGARWFESEQPDAAIKRYVNAQLNRVQWQVDYVLSHTVPLSAIPVDALLDGIDQSSVDQSTELWLERIERQLAYERWYAGHFHVNTCVDKVQLLFEDFIKLGEQY